MKDAKKPVTNGSQSIFLLGQGFSNNNLGVHALATGTVASVLNAYPDARLCFLDYDSAPAVYDVHVPAGRVPVPMLNIRFSKKLFLPNHIFLLVLLGLLGKGIPSAGLRKRFYAKNRCLAQIQDAAFVAALGGGDSFSDIYGQQRLWYVVLPQLLAVLLGRPLVLLPQTVGPFQTAMGRFLARWLLKRAQRICTRDTESLDEVVRLLGYKPSNAAFAYDLGFALDPLPPAPETQEQVRALRQGKELVGLNVSGLLYAGGYTGGNQFGLCTDYRQLLPKLLELILQRPGTQVLLVPHVLGGPEDAESDITACHLVMQELGPRFKGRLHQLEGSLNHHQTKWVIGQCDFFLGSRMHACIAAISQGVPALGLAYSRKFAGVFGSIGADNLVVDLTRMELPAVLATIQQRLDQRSELGARLRAAAPGLRQAALDLFKNGTAQSLERSTAA